MSFACRILMFCKPKAGSQGFPSLPSFMRTAHPRVICDFPFLIFNSGVRVRITRTGSFLEPGGKKKKPQEGWKRIESISCINLMAFSHSHLCQSKFWVVPSFPDYSALLSQTPSAPGVISWWEWSANDAQHCPHHESLHWGSLLGYRLSVILWPKRRVMLLTHVSVRTYVLSLAKQLCNIQKPKGLLSRAVILASFCDFNVTLFKKLVVNSAHPTLIILIQTSSAEYISCFFFPMPINATWRVVTLIKQAVFFFKKQKSTLLKLFFFPCLVSRSSSATKQNGHG